MRAAELSSSAVVPSSANHRGVAVETRKMTVLGTRERICELCSHQPSSMADRPHLVQTLFARRNRIEDGESEYTAKMGRGV